MVLFPIFSQTVSNMSNPRVESLGMGCSLSSKYRQWVMHSIAVGARASLPHTDSSRCEYLLVTTDHDLLPFPIETRLISDSYISSRVMTPSFRCHACIAVLLVLTRKSSSSNPQLYQVSTTTLASRRPSGLHRRERNSQVRSGGVFRSRRLVWEYELLDSLTLMLPFCPALCCSSATGPEGTTEAAEPCKSSDVGRWLQYVSWTRIMCALLQTRTSVSIALV